jgi:regulator of protease activity HflC (stomatin/prohibitin superfamily)
MSASQTRLLLTIGGAAAVVGAVIALYTLPPPPSPLNWALDIAAFLVTYVGGLVIISQFILPVQTTEDRRRVLKHFLEYGFGARSPIIFIKEGKFVARKDELKLAAHGVALLDSSSALVLERQRTWPGLFGEPVEGQRDEPLVRAVGPGVAFIQAHERIVAALDLRKQSRGGPVKALTQDGLEVTANVSVTFGISLDPPRGASADSEPSDRNKPARVFDPERAFRAVYGAALGDKQPVEWADLPAQVAAESFRNVLSEYALDSLFQPTVTSPQHYPYSDFQARVTQAVKEAPILRERGIHVFSVSVGVPRMPREVLNQRVRTWRARWQRATYQRLAAVESENVRALGHWRARAQEQVIKELQTALAENPQLSKQALALIMTRSMQTAARDPLTRKMLSAETLRMLDSLQEYVK